MYIIDFWLTVRMPMPSYGKLDYTQITYLWFSISLRIHKTNSEVKCGYIWVHTQLHPAPILCKPGCLKYIISLCCFTLFSVPILLRDSVTKQSKTSNEEHKSKIYFQLSFFLPHPTLSVLHWICMHQQPLHCQLLFYFSNINHVAWVVNSFSTIEWFQQTFKNRIH